MAGFRQLLKGSGRVCVFGSFPFVFVTLNFHYNEPGVAVNHPLNVCLFGSLDLDVIGHVGARGAAAANSVVESLVRWR
jgi:hypothetical protein